MAGGIDTRIRDGHGKKRFASVQEAGDGHFGVSGLVVLTEPLVQFDTQIRPFLNPTFGAEMARDASFSGNPEIIHNGGTSLEWTGSAVQGAWNFADGGAVSITQALNNDSATFAEETPATIAMSGFTAITGVINLTTYSDISNDITVIFDLAGVIVGNSVNLNDFIDTGVLGTAQAFVIPKEDMGIASDTVDGFTITIARDGGARPTMTFDDIQIEQIGAPAVFKVTTAKDTRYHIDSVRYTLIDGLTGKTSVTDGTQTATLPNLPYDKLMGINALTNGVVFQRVNRGVTAFSLNLKNIGDFLRTGADIVNLVSDGTTGYLNLEVKFREPILIEGDENSFMSLTISENLSDLTSFRAITRGVIEI